MKRFTFSEVLMAIAIFILLAGVFAISITLNRRVISEDKREERTAKEAELPEYVTINGHRFSHIKDDCPECFQGTMK